MNVFKDIKSRALTGVTGDVHGNSYLGRVAAMQIGAGSKVMRADDSGLWLGAATWEDAPFKVDMEGNATATSISVSGYIATGGAGADVNAGATAINPGKVLISGSTHLSDWSHDDDATYIDGGNIYTNTITATQIAASTITATEINVSQLSAIAADMGTITAGTITGGNIRTAASGARVDMFPDANTGIVAYDDAAGEVFKVLVAGDDVGDVVIGDYSSNKGIKWDKSETTFTVRGTLNATDLTVGTLSVDRISAGAIVSSKVGSDLTDANISSINFNNITATNISASSINTGTLNASVVTVSNLNAGNITAGTLSVDRISAGSIVSSKVGSDLTDSNISSINFSNISASNISASNINTGTLNASVVSVTNLNASNITTGTLSAVTVRSSAGNDRVELSTGDSLDFYQGGTKRASLEGISVGLYTGQSIYCNRISTNITQGSGKAFFDGDVYVGDLYDKDNSTLTIKNKIDVTGNDIDAVDNIDCATISCYGGGENRFTESVRIDGYLTMQGPIYANGNDIAGIGTCSGTDYSFTGSKSFLIPHPDGSERLLRYSSLEGPEVALYVRGVGIIKGSGATEIKLPKHFTLVTSDVFTTAQVTGIDDDVRLGASPTNESIVVVGNPGTSFNWEVTCIRKDYEDREIELDINEEDTKEMKFRRTHFEWAKGLSNKLV